MQLLYLRLAFPRYLFGYFSNNLIRPRPIFERSYSNNLSDCDYNWVDVIQFGRYGQSFDWKNGGSGINVGDRNAPTNGGDQWEFLTKAPLPVNKLGGNGKSATIIELLKVWFYVLEDKAAVDSSLTISLCTGDISGDTEFELLGDPRTLAGFRRTQAFDGSIGSGGFQLQQTYPVEVDLTDGAGHGVLVATDNIFAVMKSSSTTVSNQAWVKMLYRQKRVGVLEYVGIVQAQQ